MSPKHLHMVSPGPALQPIYQNLATHQRTEPWEQRNLISGLQDMAGRFIAEFKLDIHEVVLRIDPLSCRRLGQFRYDYNGFGLRGEITFNTRYLNRPYWQTLGTLLHELLHAWQQAHGTPGKRNHHNREFRDKAESLGLLIDQRGVTSYAENGLFKDLLRAAGIDLSDHPEPAAARIRGRSKLFKWSCGCGMNVRCARELHAVCTDCGLPFALQGG